MTKIKWGSFVTDGRGKVGSTVYSKNAGGAYLKELVIPTNPQTSYQQDYRAAFSSLTTAWSSLTDSQRTQWIKAVNRWQRTDIFGDVRKPSGFHLYMRVNLQLARITDSPMSTPPLPVTMPVCQSIVASLSISGNTFIADVGVDQLTSTCRMVIRATPVVNAGRSYVLQKFADIVWKRGQDPTYINFFDEYTGKYGYPDEGKRIGVAAQWVNRNTGQTSAMIHTSALVEA